MAQYKITVDSKVLHQLFLGNSQDEGMQALLESVLNQILDAQVTEQLGAERYERTDERKAQAPDLENNIFLDQEVHLGNAQNGTKMTHTLRLIKTKDSEGNVVILITNCFDMSAKEIGDLYRYRWKIETFFKWMKQHLKLKTFYGKSENAVYSQIWIALITYCLKVLLQLEFKHEGTLLELTRSLRNLLFKPLDEFIRSLFRKPTRKSKGRRKYDWETEFQWIVNQYERGEVDHLNSLVYDPIFI